MDSRDTLTVEYIRTLVEKRIVLAPETARVLLSAIDEQTETINAQAIAIEQLKKQTIDLPGMAVRLGEVVEAAINYAQAVDSGVPCREYFQMRVALITAVQKLENTHEHAAA